MTQQRLKLIILLFIISTALLLISMLALASLSFAAENPKQITSVMLYVLLGISIFGFIFTTILLFIDIEPNKNLNNPETTALTTTSVVIRKEIMESTDAYKDLPSYLGKQVFITHDITARPSKHILPVILSASVFMFLRVFGSNFSFENLNIFTLFVAFIIFCYVMLNIPNNKVIIDEEGVQSIIKSQIGKRKLTWDEIDKIGIVNSYNSYEGTFLCFTTKYNKGDEHADINNNTPYNIVVRYSPQIAHCVLHYRNEKIYNLEYMKSWEVYLKYLKSQ